MGVAVASAGPYANHLHLAADRYHTITSSHHSIFYRLHALPDAHQQCQSTEGNGNQMLIYWLVNTSFNPQGCGHHSTNCCNLCTPSAGCKTKPTINCKNCTYVCVCVSLCIHNTAQNGSHNLLYYLHCSDVAYDHTYLVV